MLTNDENERNKYDQEAFTNYISSLTTKSGTHMKHVDFCTHRIKLICFSSDLIQYQQLCPKVDEDDYPYGIAVKYKNTEALRKESFEELTKAIPSRDVVNFLLGFLKNDADFSCEDVTNDDVPNVLRTVSRGGP